MPRQPPKPPDRLPPVFAPTETHPLLDDFTLRAIRHQAKQVPGTPPVFPLPLRNHPMWSGNNELGREAVFAPDANNRQMVLKMGEWGLPDQWTIALGMAYDRANAVAINTAFTVVAEIIFGSGGTTQIVEVDWKQGSSITVPANTIVVNASYPFQEVPGSSTPLDLVLHASVARGGMGGCYRPTRTFFRITFSSGGSTSPFIPVPPFAKNVSVYPYSNNLTVTHFQFYTNVIVTQSMGTDSLVNNIGFPATQLLHFLDFANQFVGAIKPIPLVEGTRTIQLVWAPLGVPTPPPATFLFDVEFEIGL